MICRSLRTGYDVKFEEFVQFVLQEAYRRPEPPDHHWRPQHDLCQPCHVKYDFIGHYETLHRDAEHVVRQISRFSNKTNVQFSVTDVDSRNRNSGELLWEFYGNVSTRNIRHLLRLYQRDYEVFGYKFPDVMPKAKYLA